MVQLYKNEDAMLFLCGIALETQSSCSSSGTKSNTAAQTQTPTPERKGPKLLHMKNLLLQPISAECQTGQRTMYSPQTVNHNEINLPVQIMRRFASIVTKELEQSDPNTLRAYECFDRFASTEGGRCKRHKYRAVKTDSLLGMATNITFKAATWTETNREGLHFNPLLQNYCNKYRKFTVYLRNCAAQQHKFVHKYRKMSKCQSSDLCISFVFVFLLDNLHSFQMK